MLAARPAGAKRSSKISTGFVSYPLSTRWLDRAKQSGASFTRVNVRWASIAPQRPRNPTSPSDPAYHFDGVDATVIAATARGLRPILTIYAAPPWAEGKGRPDGLEAGVWKPSPAAFGAFAHALAKRYSGLFPLLPPHLPTVRYFEIWNEPNLAVYLAPQFRRKKPLSPTLYANLLNAAYSGIKTVSSKDQVIAGSTAPFGHLHRGKKMAPIKFLDSLFCVDKAQRCAPTPHLNILSHHPINRGAPPTEHAMGKMNVAVPDLGRIKRVLHAARNQHKLLPGGTVPLWVTEFWWESNPPDKKNGVPVKTQARWIEKALYLFWKAGAPVALNLQIVDSHLPHPDPRPLTYQTGIFFYGGRKKPSYTGFRFPFVSHRVSKRKVAVWGQAPQSGKLKIQARRLEKHLHHHYANKKPRQRRHRRWRTVKRIHVSANTVFTSSVKLRGHVKLRGQLGQSRTIVWRQH